MFKRLFVAALLTLLPGLAFATTITDDFNRANGDVGSNWTSYSSGAKLQIDTNRARSGAAAYRENGYSASSTASADYTVCTTFKAGTDGALLVWARASGEGATHNGYRIASFKVTSGFDTWNLARTDADVDTNLIGNTTWAAALVANDVLCIRVSGSTISVIKNTAVISSATDSTYTATGQGRLGIYDPDNSSGPVVDDFSWSDLPVFTSAPAVSARTTSSITISFTSLATGTVYGVRVVDGSGAPTCTQIKAGQNSSGSAAVQSWSEPVVATVADSHAFSSITDGTVTDSYYCINDTLTDSSVVSLGDLYKLPVATASMGSQTATDYTLSVTLDGPGLVYAVACKLGSTAPNVANVEAGTCPTTAVASSNRSGTGSLVLGSGLTRPIHDIYVVGTYGAQHEAATHGLSAQMLNAPAGSQYITADVPWGGSAHSVFENASPAVADGDIWLAPTFSTPDSYAITQNADGTFVIVAGGDTARQSFVSNVFDVSADAWYGTFTTWVNNVAPVQIGAPSPLILQVQTGVAITSIDLHTLFLDQEGDALTFAVSPSSPDVLPANIVLNSGVLSGSFLAEGTYHFKFRVTDVTGDYVDSAPITYTVQNTVAVPNVIGLTLANALTAINTAGLASTGGSTAYACSAEPAGYVISQSPSGGEQAAALSTVFITVSLSCSVVPDVVLQQQSDAEDTLEDQGFTVAVQTVPSYCTPAGAVHIQSPRANTAVSGGVEVSIFVSSGPPDSRVVRCAKGRPPPF